MATTLVDLLSAYDSLAPRAPSQSLEGLPLLSEDNQTIVGIPWGPKDPRFSINGKISRVRTLNEGLPQ